MYYVPAKLCNQRKLFSHDVEMNNKGILHFIFRPTLHYLLSVIYFRVSCPNYDVKFFVNYAYPCVEAYDPCCFG